MRSSAIQSVQNGSEKAARPPEGCPAEAGGLFGPEPALGFDHPSGTNARRPGQKAEKRYLLPAPPNGQVWHKAFFMVGPGAGP